MQTVPAVQQPLVQDPDKVTVISSEKNRPRKTNNRLPKLNLPTTIANVITAVLLLAIAWLTALILCQRFGISSKSILLFSSMIIASYVAGQISFACGLPQVVPMYLIGTAFRTFHLFNELENWTLFSNLRYLAVTVILVKSGLALNLNTAQSYPTQVLKSSFVICTMEAMALTIVSRAFLPDTFPPLWSFIFGFVNAATSPTKFSSELANMKTNNRYNNPKLQAIWGFSASIEIIYCISVFSVLMSILMKSHDNQIVKLLLECGKLCLGLIAGSVLGIIIGYLPHKDDVNSPLKRFTGLWLGVISIYFGAKSYSWGPGGPLGTFVSGISANTVWTHLSPSNKGSVLRSFNKLWDWCMEPMLFSLVGYEIDLNDLPMSSYEITISVACLAFGTLIRFIVSLLIHYTTGFAKREVVFLTLAGLPKATVQAAISPQMLDLLRGTEQENRAKALVLGSIINCLLVSSISTLLLHYFSGKLLKDCDKRRVKWENNNTA